MALLVKTIFVLIKLIAIGWGSLALWYIVPEPWHWFLVLIWLLIGLFNLIYIKNVWRKCLRLIFYCGFIAILISWLSLAPSHDRVWADDVANLLESKIENNKLTIKNVRNFEWSSEKDYIKRWETREYDLDKLSSADLILSYWMGPTIAHTLVSFGFEDGRKLVFSLEIRKETHEEFSALAGFFRQYETIIIAADENDILRVRTNVREEDVHMYRLNLSKPALRTALLGYLQEAENIRQKPSFYNTLTSNCTTIIYHLAQRLKPGLPVDYRLLLSGYFDRYAFDHAGLVPGYEFKELKANSGISNKARSFDGTPAQFSKAIRVGIPGISKPIETVPNKEH